MPPANGKASIVWPFESINGSIGESSTSARRTTRRLSKNGALSNITRYTAIDVKDVRHSVGDVVRIAPPSPFEDDRAGVLLDLWEDEEGRSRALVNYLLASDSFDGVLQADGTYKHRWRNPHEAEMYYGAPVKGTDYRQKIDAHRLKGVEKVYSKEDFFNLSKNEQDQAIFVQYAVFKGPDPQRNNWKIDWNEFKAVKYQRDFTVPEHESRRKGADNPRNQRSSSPLMKDENLLSNGRKILQKPTSSSSKMELAPQKFLVSAPPTTLQIEGPATPEEKRIEPRSGKKRGPKGPHSESMAAKKRKLMASALLSQQSTQSTSPQTVASLESPGRQSALDSVDNTTSVIDAHPKISSQPAETGLSDEIKTPKKRGPKGPHAQSARRKRLEAEAARLKLQTAGSSDNTNLTAPQTSRRVRGTGIREYKGVVRHVRSVAKVMAGLRPTLAPRATALSIANAPSDLARLALHISSVPETLPCREEEYGMVYGCIAGALEEGMGSCIYISGIPGTGKTATVNEVIRTLQQLADENEIPAFKFVEINGMKITDPTHAYVLLWEALSENQELTTSRNALSLLQKQFHSPSVEQKMCVVVMDELDQMATKKQDVMYNFFNWPSLPHSRLIVIAIANTMDLPERTLSNKITSRLGHQRIAYQPYDANQLVQIVASRLEGLDIFQPSAIELAARRVSAITGDARRALDICRRAIDLAESRIKEERKAKSDGVELAVMVEPADIIAATREMTQSTTGLFIKSAAFHQKVFLCCTFQVVLRKGLGEVSFQDIAAYQRSLCRQHGWTVPSLEELSDICHTLGLSRAIVSESDRLGIMRKVRLAVEESDLRAGLMDDPRVSVLLR